MKIMAGISTVRYLRKEGDPDYKITFPFFVDKYV